jgi:xyloglucan-specific exo-beta-1,4-glucanase
MNTSASRAVIGADSTRLAQQHSPGFACLTKKVNVVRYFSGDFHMTKWVRLSASFETSVRAALASALVALSASATVQAVPLGWKNVDVRGMGYVTGMVIHEKAPYARYIRTDVGGVYFYDAAGEKWINRCDKFTRLQKEVCDVESVAVDASNVNRVWKAAPLGRELLPDGTTVEYKGEVLVSDDRGVNWRATGLAAKNVFMGGNEDFRGMAGERLLVDPFDAERVYFGSRKQGLWVRSGGASGSWSQVSGGLPTALEDPGVTFVVADRSAGALNGRAKTLFAGVYGRGVWRSDDAGATWKQATGSPNAYPVRAAVASNSALFVTFGGDEGGNFKGAKIDGGAWRLKAGAWTRMANSATGSFAGVAVDPNNANNVAVAKGGGRVIYRSNNGGDAWVEVPKSTILNEPSYYPKPKPSNYNAYVGEWGNAALVYDPEQRDKVWQTNGFGVVFSQDFSAAKPFWGWSMLGLEELVVRQVKGIPTTLPGSSDRGAEMMSVVADMIGFRHEDVRAIPNSTLAPIDYVAGGTGIDFSYTNPRYMAFVGWDQDKGGWWAKRTGFSDDNGRTFKPFANETPGSAGVIAMSATNPDNIVWAPTRWAKPHFTTDRGATWKIAKTTDGKDLPASFKLSNEWWAGQILAADRIDGKRFYYFDGGRFYTSADSGATWKAAPQEGWQIGLAPWWTIDTNVVVNPEKSGEVYLTFAPNTNQLESFKLWRSDDFGMTFKSVNTAESVNFMAFGKGDVAGTPYMFIHGRANGATTDGVYRSRNNGATWELVSVPSENQFGKINSMSASPSKKDVVYIGTGGRGMFASTPDTLIGPSTGAVNAGGPASGVYRADTGFTGGYTFTSNKAIDTSAVQRPGEQVVYQSERFGNSFTFRPPALAEGRRYLVRLHFAEIWWGVAGYGGTNTGAGNRVFDVSWSNLRQAETKVLTNFDIFKAAGGANKAYVFEFEAYSDGTGTINLKFDAAANSPDRNAKISAIEFIELGF